MCVVLKSPSFYMHKVAIGVVYTKLLDAITVTSVKQYTDVDCTYMTGVLGKRH